MSAYLPNDLGHRDREKSNGLSCCGAISMYAFQRRAREPEQCLREEDTGDQLTGFDRLTTYDLSVLEVEAKNPFALSLMRFMIRQAHHERFMGEIIEIRSS